jgi:haloacetate dehalogenase
MSDRDLFPGFKSGYFDTEEGNVFVRHGGEGPPVLMLHGFPQTHVCWHRIAPELAKTNHVVCMDMRGYGWSSAPRGGAGHQTYSKRAMGRDAVRVMSELGYTQFALVGHDRGARVGYRLALDHPGRLTHLALLDIVPTITAWKRIEAGEIPAAHWEFLARPHPEPEEAISKDAVAFFDKLMAGWTLDGTLDAFDRRALSAYRMASNEPSRIHAFCEDYRAGATIDRAQDESDLAARKTILCPTFVIWGEFYLSGSDDPDAPSTLDVWRSTFAPDAQGTMVRSGHFVAEEAPDETLRALHGFLS